MAGRKQLDPEVANMSLLEIVSWLGLGGIAVMSIVQIAPIKIDPWTWIARHIGRAINGEVMQSVNALASDVQELKDQRARDQEERKKDNAETRRTRILRFSDELRQNVRHSEESFNQVLEDIDSYRGYCADHPRYANTKAETAIRRIKEVYQKCLGDNSFL